MGVVQFKGSGAGGAPASVTFDSAVTAGHSVVVGLIVYGSTHIVQGNITGAGGDTYTLLHTPAGNAAIETQAAFFLCQSVSSGTQTISCSSHTAQAIAAWDVDDLSASAFDKSGIGVGTSSAASTAATGTLAQAAERVFAIVGTDQGNSDTITQTAGEGWTFSGETEAGATDQCFNAVHKLVAATTAVSASWALAGSHNWACAIATFKQTAASGSTGTAAWTEADDTCAAAGLTVNHVFVSYVKEVGFVTNTTTGTTSAITVASGGVPVGDTIVIYAAHDNSNSTTAGAIQTTSVADNSSQSGSANSYAVQTHAIADPGAANAGAEGWFAVCTVTRALLAGDVITITYSFTTPAKAISAQQFTNVKRGTPILSGTPAVQNDQTGQAVSVAATATQIGQVVCALVAVEGGTADAFTQDNDTTGGAWVTLTRRGSGTTTSGATLNSTYKLLTATGAQTYNGTTMLGTARDHCAAILILDITPQGPAAWTEADSTTAATGQRGHAGTSSWTEAADTLAGVGLLPQSGPAAWTEAADTLAAAGIVGGGGGGGQTGTAAWLEASDTLTAAGLLPQSGTGSWTEAADTMVAAGTRGHKGTGAWTEVADTGSAVGTPTRKGAAAWTEATDTLAAAGTRGHKGTAAWTEEADTLAGQDSIVYYPATISGRKWLDQTGRVFFLRTVSSWRLASLSQANITTALTGVAADGFNGVTVWVGGGGNYGAGWTEYALDDGSPWWTGTPWASSLGTAWNRVDYMLDECRRLGLVATLSFNGGNGSTGAKAEWAAVTNAQMYSAGTAIATRYANVDHILWHVMFDDGTFPGDTPGIRIKQLFDGINDTEGATRRLRWIENNQGDSTNQAGWLTDIDLRPSVNCQYEYTGDAAVLAEAVYAEVTTVPVGDCEPPYDGAGHVSPEHQQIRERSYADALEGGVLVNVGHEQWWTFGAAGLFGGDVSGDWTNVMAHSLLVHHRYLWQLVHQYVETADWVPEAGTFVTTGAGTTDTKVAAGKSALAAIAYFPTSRTIAVDTTIVTGTGPVRLRWMDPTTGTFSTIAASEAQQTGRSVTYPGNNAAGETDQVLVLDQPAAAVGAWTETDDTLAAVGTPKRIGTAAWTEASDVFSASGKPGRAGTGTWTEAADTLTAAGIIGHKATAAWAETIDVAVGTGVGHTQTGTAAWSEAGDAFAAAGIRSHKGTSTWAEDGDVLAAVGGTGTLKGGPAAWTETSDVATSSGKVGHRALLAWTEHDDLLVAAGSVARTSAISWTEADDVFVATGGPFRIGTAAWTEASDVFSAFESEAPPWGAVATVARARAVTSTGGPRAVTSRGNNL